MRTDDLPVSFRLRTYDGLNFDVEANAHVNWVQSVIGDEPYADIIKCRLDNLKVNGKELSYAESVRWQSQYYFDYEEHLRWLLISTFSAEEYNY